MKKGSVVIIPTSELGVRNGLLLEGTVLARWGGVLQVDFDGHLGQYTISKHNINLVRE